MRTMRTIRAVSLSVIVLSAVFTVVIGLYMAHPGGDVYAYRTGRSYMTLAGFLLFAVAPHVALLLLRRAFRDGKALFLFLVGACAIAVFGVYAYFDVAFIHPDAQGGLVFVFMPIYQWLAIVVLVPVCLVTKRLSGA